MAIPGKRLSGEPKVTITPRMLEAGVLALVRLGWGLDGQLHESLEEAASDVYGAMAMARE
jgi:hypothetical protein